RFSIDNSSRTLHGALLDSEILAEVYLELIGGRQPGFGLPIDPVPAKNASSGANEEWRPRPRPVPLPSRLTEAEAAAHAAMIEKMGDKAIWRR
ncbi:MAG: DNA polymerase III subunit epsilon, partial [Paracoccaceae bacterium]